MTSDFLRILDRELKRCLTPACFDSLKEQEVDKSGGKLGEQATGKSVGNSTEPPNPDLNKVESENLQIENSSQKFVENVNERPKPDSSTIQNSNIDEMFNDNWSETSDENLSETSNENLSDRILNENGIEPSGWHPPKIHYRDLFEDGTESSGWHPPKILYRNLFEPLDEDLLQPPTENYCERPPINEFDSDDDDDDDNCTYQFPNEHSSNDSSTYHSMNDNGTPNSKISTSEAETNDSSNKNLINDNETPNSKLLISVAETKQFENRGSENQAETEECRSISKKEIRPKNVISMFPFEW
jgi:hypothetical protein